MIPTGVFAIPLDHPCLPGHFPGSPIVPGVILLAEVFALLCTAHPGMRVAGLLHAKFLRPVRPGEVVAVSSRATDACRVEFIGAIGNDRALRGAVRLAPAPLPA